MNKKLVVTGALMVALSAPFGLVGCSGSGDAPQAQAEQSSDSSSDFDAVAFYNGTWRGSVETTGQTVYGTAGGSEQMIDVILNEDGTAETKPCKNHEDLLTEEGTWEAADDKSVTVKLPSGDITLTVVDETNMTGDPTDFGIDGFDQLDFTLY